jgi:hypothetical protein
VKEPTATEIVHGLGYTLNELPLIGAFPGMNYQEYASLIRAIKELSDREMSNPILFFAE